MARRILPLTDLDALLDPLAETPEAFEARAIELAKQLDRSRTALEIRDPISWRKADVETGTRARATDQLRADVESIELMDREEEARHARRVEFARLRLALARESAGEDTENVLEGVGQLASQWYAGAYAKGGSSKLPSARVTQRAAELHALRTELVERNLYLALINVERYVHSSTNRPDLIQEGSAALYRAVDGFDWRRGLLFRTYAVHWLNQAFRNYLYNFSNTVRVPVYLQKAMKQINQAQVRLGDTNASPERIAEVSDLQENLVASALGAHKSSYSLDADVGEEGEGNRLRDLLVFEEEDGPYTTRLEEITLEEGLDKALDRLSDRERLVVRMRFGLGDESEHTLAQVAEHLGVSVERVRQIQVRAISKLDTPALRRELEPFLN